MNIEHKNLYQLMLDRKLYQLNLEKQILILKQSCLVDKPFFLFRYFLRYKVSKMDKRLDILNIMIQLLIDVINHNDKK